MVKRMSSDISFDPERNQWLPFDIWEILVWDWYVSYKEFLDIV
jgi:hypothetical protein